MRYLGWGLGILLIASLGVSVFFVRLMADVGSFRQIEAHFDGTCETIDGFAGGTEDVLIDHDTGWVLVSSFDRRTALANPGAPVRGAIEAFHPDTGVGPLTISPAMPADFRPHGFSLYSGPEGKRLFVISHAADGTQAIELFDLSYATNGVPTLRHVETITDDLIISPNDLAAVGPRSFYVGNDSQYADHDTLAYMFEIYGRLSRTNVIYYDGERASIAANQLTYTNGVEISNDGSILYVAETTDGVLRIYDRDIGTGELTMREGTEGRLRFNSGLDNIDVDAAGRVWIGGHPKLFDFAAHAEDASALSPAQILMIDPADHGEGGLVHEVYMGTGELASGSSVGAFFDGRMIIGVVFEPHIIVCQVADPVVVGE